MRLPLIAVLTATCLGGLAQAIAGAPKVPVDTLPRHAVVHVNFVTLPVADFQRAFRFYAEVLGMHERGRAQPNVRQFEVVMGFDNLPTSTGISLTVREEAPNPRGNGSSSINLVVRDLAQIMRLVTRNGGAVVTPLLRVESAGLSYSLARIADPDGNAIELVEYHRIGAAESAAVTR